MRTPRLPVVDWTDPPPGRFKWTRPFRRKTKSCFCACAITFQTQSTYRNIELWVRHSRCCLSQIIHIGVIGTVVLVRRRIAVRWCHWPLRRSCRRAATASATSCSGTHTHTQARIPATVQAAVNGSRAPDGGIAGVVERGRRCATEQRFDVATGWRIAVMRSRNDRWWWGTGRRTGVCVVVGGGGWRWLVTDGHSTGWLALAARGTRRTASTARLLTSVLLMLLLLLVLFLLLTTFRAAVLEPDLQRQHVVHSLSRLDSP